MLCAVLHDACCQMTANRFGQNRCRGCEMLHPSVCRIACTRRHVVVGAVRSMPRHHDCIAVLFGAYLHAHHSRPTLLPLLKRRWAGLPLM